MIKVPAKGMSRRNLSDIMYTCIIFHNMIIRNKGRAMCPIWFEDEGHRDHDPLRSHEQSLVINQEIIDRTTHLNLKADLIKHVWANRENEANEDTSDDES